MEKINFPLITFLVYSAKCIALGSSLSDALALFAICGLVAFERYLSDKKQPEVNNAVLQEVAELRSAVGALKINQTFRRN